MHKCHRLSASNLPVPPFLCVCSHAFCLHLLLNTFQQPPHHHPSSPPSSLAADILHILPHYFPSLFSLSSFIVLSLPHPPPPPPSPLPPLPLHPSSHSAWGSSGDIITPTVTMVSGRGDLITGSNREAVSGRIFYTPKGGKKENKRGTRYSKEFFFIRGSR